MTYGKRVPSLKDIPLEGPVSQTITPPPRRHGGLVAAIVVLFLVAGVLALLTVNPDSLAVVARAFGR